jgi:class 3 adenylate cyclase
MEHPAPIAAAQPPVDLVTAGRDALSRRQWREGFDLLSQASSNVQLTGADFEALADAAFFAARPDARLDALERAFAAHERADDPIRAAYAALLIADWATLRGKASVASGWTRRGERLLDGREETYAHAYLALVRGEMAKASGDPATAADLTQQAIDIAGRTNHPDMRAMGMANLAMLRIATGATREGLTLLEEAAVSAVNGELSPITAGITSCQMIAVCRDLTDYQRAGQWIEETDRWCKREEVSGFPGICRVHRAELKALKGAWAQAEQELERATSELEAYSAFPPLADGLYALGEVRRLKGDLEGAEAALRRAHSFGRSPQPALALIRLASGKASAAAAALEAELEEAIEPWARARLLGAQVEVALAAGNVGGARAAVDEVGRIGESFRPPAAEAAWRLAVGRVLLAERNPAGATRELRAALRLWLDLDAKYEVARARLALARALRSLGDEDSADYELEAARAEFERLGAQPDLEAVDAELRAIATRKAGPQVVRMAFMFTDIVNSTGLAEALGDQAWEAALGWHDETLRGLIGRHGGRVVNTTGDGFFAAFPSAKAGLDSAVDIQRTLAAHRRTTGFAAPVRIGVHLAEATQRGEDYSGIGVHVAARIGALASAGEVLASADALREAGDVDVAAEQSVDVKGVSAPIQIAALRWT